MQSRHALCSFASRLFNDSPGTLYALYILCLISEIGTRWILRSFSKALYLWNASVRLHNDNVVDHWV